MFVFLQGLGEYSSSVGVREISNLCGRLLWAFFKSYFYRASWEEKVARKHHSTKYTTTGWARLIRTRLIRSST